jgi:hypothetical protein
MKKILFLILLFILLATVATVSPPGAKGPGPWSARSGLAARHAGH